VNAVSRVAISSVLAIGGSLAVFRLLPFLPGGRKLVLATALGGAQSTERPERPSLLGAVGKSLSPLRPAGIADIAGQRVDVVSEGEFIDPGQDIEVVREEGNRVVVKRLAPSPTKGT
jgi:membrane-bound serine protease (ClpP class)